MHERAVAAAPATRDDAPSLPPSPAAGSGRAAAVAAAGLAAAVAAILLFGAVGHEFYGDFQLPQGSGMYSLLPEELAFTALFLIFGLIVWAGLFIAIAATRLPETLVALAAALGRRPRLFGVIVAVTVTGVSAVIGARVLGHAVISDDEHVYRFIARTLRGGALTAPSPGTDLPFFREQFVVLTERARYGKYPIGHPLLLALGQSVHLEHLVVPLVTGLAGILVVLMARDWSGPSASVLAGALYATSPQVLFTGATYLSQPAAALCLCGAVAALIRAREARAPAWCALAGALLCYGILVRPLPSVLFVPVAAAFLAFEGRRLAPGAARALAALIAPVLIAIAAMALVNKLQAGHALVTGYAQSRDPERGAEALLLLTVATPAMRAMSVIGSLIRWDTWLFGWPLSFLFCWAARFSGPGGLMWGLVGTEIVYRLLAPKVGVGGAGPIYLYEAAPVLCVLSADGAVRLARSVRGWRVSPRTTTAVVLAGTIVSLCAFVPSRLLDLRRMGAAQNLPHEMMRERGIHNALVFHQGVVPWWTRLSWAYYPPCNSPSLDDDVLFLWLPPDLPPAAVLDFQRRRYPSRSAWLFGYEEARPFLRPLGDAPDAGVRSPGVP